MPRKRSQVKEASSELQRIEATVTGTRYESAIRMLRLLEEDPERTLTEVSAMLDRSERTVRRWWRLYLDEGIEALLETAPAGGRRPSRLDAAALESFRRRVRDEGFPELKDAQQWLVQEFDVEYSLSRVSELVKTVRASANGIVPDAGHPALDRVQPEERADLSHLDLVTVLNSIPTSADPVEWGVRFSELMMGLAPDIDRVSVNIDTHARLRPEADQDWGFRLIQYPVREEGISSSITCIVHDPNNPDTPPFKQLLTDFEIRGYPTHLYHAPVPFDYTSEFGGYVGSLIVWRRRECKPTSGATLLLFERLRPFIASAFSNAIARYQRMNPADTAFYATLDMIRCENNLTIQETRIIALRLLGYSYQEVADMLSVCVATIKKHLNSIHHKTNTRSHAKLFARYFATRKWV